MELAELNSAINELENTAATYNACEKLASLYVVRDHLREQGDRVIDELEDILPSYKEYCRVKGKYQLGKASIEQVNKELNSVCREINEFLLILYRNTEHTDSRELIYSMLERILVEVE